MSTAPIITDLQKINPSAIIELFTLQLMLHCMVQQLLIDFITEQMQMLMEILSGLVIIYKNANTGRRFCF